MFVSLHPLSREGGATRRGRREPEGKREDIEKSGTREIACVDMPAAWPRAETLMSQKVLEQKAILTMKSLILAQDER